MKKIEDILAQFPFRHETDEAKYDHDFAKKEIIEKVELPAFYTFDEPTPVYNIHVESAQGGLSIITASDAEGNPVGGWFGDLAEAYDYIKREFRGDVTFSGDLKSITGDDDPLFITVPSTVGGRKMQRMLFSHTSSDEEYLAKSNYLYFLERTLRYEANPDDFRTAWNWVDSHPAFWTRYEGGHQWSTENNGKVWVGISSNKAGETVVMLEHGAAIEPERTSHYHDLRLDAYGSTYEEAFIQLAALVHKFFNWDGSERENVEYEKSDLEKVLEDRLASLAELDNEE